METFWGRALLKVGLFFQLFSANILSFRILLAHLSTQSNSEYPSSAFVGARFFAGRGRRSSAKASGLALLPFVLLLAILASGCSAYLTPNSPGDGHPAITAPPASKTVTAGQSASFSVTATGAAPLSYQWKKNGAAIGGATASSYSTPATTGADNGAQFTVSVSNSVGSSTSSAAILTVKPVSAAPSITAQPASQTVTVGESASFSVTATGAAPLNYQWKKNGAAISGATASSYSTPATTSADNGAHFTVVVSNTAGNATSNAATLTVNATNPGTLAVWTAPVLDRVATTDAPGSASSINLFGARGETVDTQVVVRAPAGGLTNVNLSATALAGPNGVTIPSSEVTLFREHYVTVKGTGGYGGGSNPPLGSGTYPEPLIPFNHPEAGAALCGTSAVLKACNASISSGQNQPYWIDISLPHGSTTTPPGTYTGSVKVTAEIGRAHV